MTGVRKEAKQPDKEWLRGTSHIRESEQERFSKEVACAVRLKIEKEPDRQCHRQTETSSDVKEIRSFTQHF